MATDLDCRKRTIFFPAGQHKAVVESLLAPNTACMVYSEFRVARHLFDDAPETTLRLLMNHSLMMSLPTGARTLAVGVMDSDQDLGFVLLGDRLRPMLDWVARLRRLSVTQIERALVASQVGKGAPGYETMQMEQASRRLTSLGGGSRGVFTHSVSLGGFRADSRYLKCPDDQLQYSVHLHCLPRAEAGILAGMRKMGFSCEATPGSDDVRISCSNPKALASLLDWAYEWQATGSARGPRNRPQVFRVGGPGQSVRSQLILRVRTNMSHAATKKRLSSRYDWQLLMPRRLTELRAALPSAVSANQGFTRFDEGEELLFGPAWKKMVPEARHVLRSYVQTAQHIHLRDCVLDLLPVASSVASDARDRLWRRRYALYAKGLERNQRIRDDLNSLDTLLARFAAVSGSRVQGGLRQLQKVTASELEAGSSKTLAALVGVCYAVIAHAAEYNVSPHLTKVLLSVSTSLEPTCTKYLNKYLFIRLHPECLDDPLRFVPMLMHECSQHSNIWIHGQQLQSPEVFTALRAAYVEGLLARLCLAVWSSLYPGRSPDEGDLKALSMAKGELVDVVQPVVDSATNLAKSKREAALCEFIEALKQQQPILLRCVAAVFSRPFFGQNGSGQLLAASAMARVLDEWELDFAHVLADLQLGALLGKDRSIVWMEGLLRCQHTPPETKVRLAASCGLIGGTLTSKAASARTYLCDSSLEPALSAFWFCLAPLASAALHRHLVASDAHPDSLASRLAFKSASSFKNMFPLLESAGMVTVNGRQVWEYPGGARFDVFAVFRQWRFFLRNLVQDGPISPIL